MKSKGDPILDAKALCEEKPLSYDDLYGSLVELGWGQGVVGAAIDMANEIYIRKRDDGKFYPTKKTS